MRMSPIVLLLGTAAFVGWIAPDLPVGPMPPAKPAAVTQTHQRETENSASHEAWLTGGTVLDREVDGHFYAEASVNSRSTRFLVDTGASMVALTGDDARAIGLSWQPSDLVAIGSGASGPVYGVPIRLDRVDLGNFTAHDVDAAIIPEGLPVSLLGQSFLTQVPGMRIEGDRMTLGGAR